jgi:acyl-CoA synthetase (AMP-forming)/AMP-acid ligase II
MEAQWPGATPFRALVGGEAVPRDLAARLLAMGVEVWNVYGPTETTIWSTCGRIEMASESNVIGRPIANTSVLVLDTHGELAPVGVPGEACIGGAGLALGYVNQPALTQERFIDNPVRGARDARLYRTGDLVRWRADGRLEHLGRMDRQIKIRGFRIEPDEIEGVLRRHRSIASAAVDTRVAGDGEPRLVAFVVYRADAELTVSEVRAHARESLPEYMVPGMVVPMSALPLTVNGKLDRGALPDPFQSARETTAAFEEPKTRSEALLAAVWQDLLQVSRVGRQDNFFALGGHSLLAVRAVSAVEQRTGHRVDPRRLFFQTLSQVASSISESQPCR